MNSNSSKSFKISCLFTGMMQCYPECECKFKILVDYLVGDQAHFSLGHVKPLLWILIGGKARDQIKRGQPGLPTRGHKNEHWFNR